MTPQSTTIITAITPEETETGGLGTGSLTTNPFTNSLKYLTRIESGSDLSGQADDSGDIGATILKNVEGLRDPLRRSRLGYPDRGQSLAFPQRRHLARGYEGLV